MEEFRCQKCNKLLGRYRECYELEIKCPRCRIMNYLMNKVISTSANNAKKNNKARTSGY